MKKNITCLIVDDEPFAQDLLRRYVDRLAYLDLVAICQNSLKALEVIHNTNPDIIFLDINMPEVSGMEMVKMLAGARPYIIFTTAYTNYAAESYDFGVVDYLLKPVSFDRFVRAVNKVSEQIELKNNVWGGDFDSGPSSKIVTENEFIAEKFFMVKSDKKLIKINIEEIVYVEGMKDYLKIHLMGAMVIVHMTITKMEEILRKHQFIRINKSYIVNIREINAINGNEVELSNKQKLTIGATFRETLLKNLQGRII
ncbi:response regulator [Dyadobacter sp. CY261]|uniref:LytR/AlgR family response regulator transcription factor n=1 Tax=Dyadobacter sp. CY261 TaxID=2907203 RepID=UPI001F2BEDA1|nr:response regulator [Dyadobacter sp. CY261]MCF0072270.1 response regulator [Dyadobacter sp. CY261]